MGPNRELKKIRKVGQRKPAKNKAPVVLSRVPDTANEPYVKIACLIAGDHPPEWLIGYLKRWCPSLLVDRHIQSRLPRRRAVLASLKALDVAADKFLAAFHSVADDPPLQEFFQNDAIGQLPYRDSLPEIVSAVVEHFRGAATLSSLAKETGSARAGRGRARPPGSFPPEIFCAMIIEEAWRAIHGAPPPPRNGKAAEAAETLFEMNGRSPPVSSSEPLEKWRDRFKKARKIGDCALRRELRRHLQEGRRQEEMLRTA